MQNAVVMAIILASMVLSAFICMLVRDLLKSAIGLAVLSALLTVVMFLLNAPIAAVFELSVCAGLITVVFISAISLTRVHTAEEKAAEWKQRMKRFTLLPILLIAVLAALVWFLWPLINTVGTTGAEMLIQGPGLREVLWNDRQLEVLGQIIIIMAGVFGIVVLFRRNAGDEINNDSDGGHGII